jgi:hypothetical protein
MIIAIPVAIIMDVTVAVPATAAIAGPAAITTGTSYTATGLRRTLTGPHAGPATIIPSA